MTNRSWLVLVLTAALVLGLAACSSNEGTTDAPAAAETEETAPAADIPEDAGALMVWTSEQQTAGNLTEAQIGEAYATLNLAVTDLFGIDDAEAKKRIASLHALMSAAM